jgi:hypothetical protein
MTIYHLSLFLTKFSLDITFTGDTDMKQYGIYKEWNHKQVVIGTSWQKNRLKFLFFFKTLNKI